MAEVDEQLYGAANDGSDEGEDKNKIGMFLPYNPATFSFLHLYRPQQDVVASLIARSGMEGIDRYELSRQLGINAKTKAGNRSVSNSIHAVLKAFPEQFGTYQKMEGRHRFIKYYVKSGEQHTPGGKVLDEFMQLFKRITGADCPYKLGEIVKFPNEKLSTLRISDVTLKRLVRILEYLYREKVLVTRSKLEAHLTAIEREEGYAFQMDRKSLRKCVLALAKKHFLNAMSSEVVERGVATKFDVITVPEIQSVTHSMVTDAVTKMQAEFRELGKIFPAGTMLKRESKEVAEKNSEIELKREPREQEEAEENEGEEGEEPGTSRGSLLDRTFNTLHRKSLKKYGRKGGGTHFGVFSQRSLNSLVDSAKQRRLAKPLRGGRKRRTLVKQEDDLPPTEDELDQQALIDIGGSRADRKRVYDKIDRQNLQHKAYLRSRFSQRERDMLLLIRACSFFLNPVARFWPHPKVIRTLMHEYVPESRNKTTFSLMAAGVREVRSKDRYAHHQYIVKTMASYKELLDWRNTLAQINLAQIVVLGDDPLRQKDYFFMDAFRTSYQLLFRESPDFPSVNVSDVELKQYLDTRNMYFLAISDKQSVQTTRTKQPSPDEHGIRHCTAYNTITSVLLSAETYVKSEKKYERDEEKEGEEATGTDTAAIANFLIQQIDIKTLADVLEQMRTDGLVTKKRGMEAKQSAASGKELPPAGNCAEITMLPSIATAVDVPDGDETSPQKLLNITSVVGGGEWQNQLKCTQFYRHYFQSEYNRSLCDSLTQLGRTADLDDDLGGEENPGQLLVLANHFCKNPEKFTIEASMPSSIRNLFVRKKSSATGVVDQIFANDAEQDVLNLTANATKQLRYLESTEFRLELLKIRADNLRASLDSIIQSLPDPEEIANRINLIPPDKMPSTENGIIASEQRKTVVDEQQDQQKQKLFEFIDQTGVDGIADEELKKAHFSDDIDESSSQHLLDALLQSGDVIACGVDQCRYASTRNASAWLVRNKLGEGFIPKPWLFPSGQTNWHILRWMLEGVFLAVFSRPGITFSELVSHFQFILQPSFTQELLHILVKLDACTVFEKTLIAMHKSAPFSRFANTQTLKFIQPCTDGLERLVLFNEFKLKPMLAAAERR